MHLGENNGLASLPWADASPTKAIVEHFRRLAGSQPAQAQPDLAKRIESWWRSLRRDAGDRVLDAGSGPGTVALAFAPQPTT